jgi:hypothetical protein
VLVFFVAHDHSGTASGFGVAGMKRSVTALLVCFAASVACSSETPKNGDLSYRPSDGAAGSGEGGEGASGGSIVISEPTPPELYDAGSCEPRDIECCGVGCGIVGTRCVRGECVDGECIRDGQPWRIPDGMQVCCGEGDERVCVEGTCSAALCPK